MTTDFSANEAVGLLKSNSLDDFKLVSIPDKKAFSTNKTNKEINDIMKFVNNDELETLSDLNTIEKSLTRAAATGQNSIKRKQIQFKLDHKKSANANTKSLNEPSLSPNPDETLNEDGITLSNIHEKLNQIKIVEIKKKKSLNASARKKRHKSIYFDFERFNLKIRQLKSNLYTFFERPVGKLGFIYRIFTFTIILCSIVTGTLTTLDSLSKWSFRLFYWFEVFTASYFALEFILRVWSSGHRSSYKGLEGRIKFMSKFLHIIELSIITFTVVLLAIIGSSLSYYKNDIIFSSASVTLLRFLQIFRFLYIDRRAQTWKLLMKVMHKHRFELLTSVYIGIFILLFSSYFILIFEKNIPNDVQFHSYADAVYWSIITMTTIGYGIYVLKYIKLANFMLLKV